MCPIPRGTRTGCAGSCGSGRRPRVWLATTHSGGVGATCPGPLRAPATRWLTSGTKGPAKARADAEKPPDGAPGGAACFVKEHAYHKDWCVAWRAVAPAFPKWGEIRKARAQNRAARTMEFTLSGFAGAAGTSPRNVPAGCQRKAPAGNVRNPDAVASRHGWQQSEDERA